MPQCKSIGDWLAGCRNALPAIVCHAIMRLKNTVENQLLMVRLDLRVTGTQAADTWGSFSNYVTLWGGRTRVTLCYIGGRQCQCYVMDRWCASFLHNTRFTHAPCMHRARASRARVLCIIFEGGSGAAVLRNLGGGSDRCYAPLLGRGVKNGQKSVT